MNPKTRARVKAYCTQCKFSIRAGELVNVSTHPAGYRHLNCKAAVMDGSGRHIDPDFKHFLDHMDPETVERILGNNK